MHIIHCFPSTSETCGRHVHCFPSTSETCRHVHCLLSTSDTHVLDMSTASLLHQRHLWYACPLFAFYIRDTYNRHVHCFPSTSDTHVLDMSTVFILPLAINVCPIDSTDMTFPFYNTTTTPPTPLQLSNTINSPKLKLNVKEKHLKTRKYPSSMHHFV